MYRMLEFLHSFTKVVQEYYCYKDKCIKLYYPKALNINTPRRCLTFINRMYFNPKTKMFAFLHSVGSQTNKHLIKK